MKIRRLQRHFLWVSAFLSACIFEDQANRGSIVDNELRVGRIYLLDGTGASDAMVRVFHVDHIPESADPAYTTRTDSGGRYVLDSLPAGEYNILAELDGQFAFQDSVYVSAQTDSISPDTLDEPGTVAGIVGMQPNHDPGSVTVQVLGTDNYANVESSGRFRLKGLAAGKYTLRLLTTVPEYTPLFVGLDVASGRSDSLEDTLRLPYTGIPVVVGLRASYDTLRGVVHLAWNKVEYRDFSEYLVFRDTGLSLTLSQQPIARVQGTAFSDTVRRPSATALFAPGDTIDRRLEYRIRVRNLSDQVGLGYGNLPVTAASLASVRTAIALETVATTWDPDREADSTVVGVSLANRTRPLAGITWALGRKDSVVATRKLGGEKSARDTLRFAWSRLGAYTVYVQVEDGAGTVWSDSLRMPGNSGPTLGGTPDSATKTLVQYRFAPVASDPDRDSLRFSASNLPSWASLDTATGVMSGMPADSQAGTYSGIVLRVSDGRRSAALPAFAIQVDTNPWRARPPMPTKEGPVGAYSFGDRIYVFHNFEVNSFDPSNGDWTKVATLPTAWSRALGGVDSAGKRLMLFDIWNSSTSPRRITPLALNPATGEIDTLSPLPDTIPTIGAVRAATAWNGRFLVFYSVNFDDVLLAEYNPTTDSWSPARQVNLGTSSLLIGNIKPYTLLDRVFFLGWELAYTYDPVTDARENLWTSFSDFGQASCVSDGKIFLMGGNGKSNGPTGDLSIYDPATKTRINRTSSPTGRRHHVCAGYSDRVFFFGGETGPTSGTPTDLVEEYIPSADK